MAVIHGSYEFRCDVCALTDQLEFARERAAAIPDLEEQLVAALAKPAMSLTSEREFRAFQHALDA